ncbi:glycoside hydrolase [Diaporthe eres]|nr:glycoside hydrolase [Diaporthe eres]
MKLKYALLLSRIPMLALGQGDYEIVDPNLFYPREPVTPYSQPSPNATGMGGWDVAVARARRFVAELTIEEKVSICTGNGFPSGNTPPISRNVPGVTAASTWNRELIRARGYAISTEFKAKGVHAVLGPVLALARVPGGGTNFEGFGADPFLTGAAGYETILGHQGAGVQAEAKQYLGYDGQQYNRTYYSSNIDDKTLHEVEIWPYAEAVRAGVACVMTSYPYVNNSQASQNAYLLNDVLKTHLGFQGYTQTDWFGLKSGVSAILAGLDQDMPGVAFSQTDNNSAWSYYGANYTAAVKNGTVPEWRLTDAATRIMTPYFWLGQDRNYPSVSLEDDPRRSITNAQRQRHRMVAREVAAAGMVLLKNTPGKKGLPLVKPTAIALFGPAAGQNPYGPNQYGLGPSADPANFELPLGYGPTPLTIGIGQGTLAVGGGSGSTFYPRLEDPISAIQQRANQDLTLVDWSTTTNLTMASFVARRATACLPVVASFSGEGVDRNLSLLHNGDDLVATVANNCDNTIPIVQSVGPVNLETCANGLTSFTEAWIDHPNVTAVIWANLGGQELGPALVDVLYGAVNPSGRLVYTIARNDSDYAQPHIMTTPQPYPQLNYTESISVDYRGFERNGKDPRYWFGHGLSYSNFTYSDLVVKTHAGLSESLKQPIQYVADAPGGDSRLYDVAIVVEFQLRNEGPWDGTEIPQLYLEMPPEAGNPTKILRGFDNVQIRDGERQNVRLFLTRKDISYWDVVGQTWVVADGTFTVLIGASSNDIRLKGTLII